MKNEPRLTKKTISVLEAIVTNSAHGISGAEIMRKTGLWSGTVYPILFRTAEAGWISGCWEKGDASKLKRPLRKLYRMKPSGLVKLEEINVRQSVNIWDGGRIAEI